MLPCLVPELDPRLLMVVWGLVPFFLLDQGQRKVGDTRAETGERGCLEFCCPAGHFSPNAPPSLGPNRAGVHDTVQTASLHPKFKNSILQAAESGLIQLMSVRP